jgi:hypothetical protein
MREAHLNTANRYGQVSSREDLPQLSLTMRREHSERNRGVEVGEVDYAIETMTWLMNLDAPCSKV